MSCALVPQQPEGPGRAVVTFSTPGECGPSGRRRRLARAIGVPVTLAVVAVAAAPGVIRVQRGDTLWELSRRFHSSVATLVRLNHLPGDTIYAGQTLRVPVGHGRPARRYPPVAVAARHRAALASGPAWSRHRVRALVGRTARRLHVDPALALAVAEQESGFRTNVVSDAGAIGVMQVLPSTGRWLGRKVVGRSLDLLDPQDNVLAGVSLLRVLTRAAPLHQAVAGYYQGLASVRRHGMYPDTRRYVASVLRLRQQWLRSPLPY